MEQDNNENKVQDASVSATPSDTNQSTTYNEPVAPVNEPNVTSGMDNAKLFAVLGYILPFLFFLPLVNDATKNNQFSRFHANQQLILLILWVAVQVVADNFLYMIMGYGAYSLVGLLSIGVLVLAVLGVINAMQNTMKELPFVGQFKIIK